MPIKEVATTQAVHYALEDQTVGNSATVAGATLDTADYDGGIYFAAAVTDWTAGAASLVIYEDDDATMATETIVAAANLIYTSPSLGTAATVEGASMAKLGCFGTKRYLRCKLVGNATCNLDAFVVAIKNAEVLPTGQGGL